MKIKIKIKNEFIELSPSEAKELFSQLNEVFGDKKESPVYIPYIPQNPHPTTPNYPWTWPYTTWCNTDNKIANTSSKSYSCAEDLAWNMIDK